MVGPSQAKFEPATSYRLQVSLSCAVLCQIVSLQCLSRSSLHGLAGLPCLLFSSNGLQVVTREVHRSSLRRLICPAQDHFIVSHIADHMTGVLSLTQMLVFLSLHLMLSILLSILVCAAASLFCACLVGAQCTIMAARMSCTPGCLFNQMTRLLYGYKL